MEHGQGNGLSRTEEALRRLDTAVGRLEGAASRVGLGDLLLAGELREARDETDALRDTSREVAERLDHTIGRLRALLEG